VVLPFPKKEGILRVCVDIDDWKVYGSPSLAVVEELDGFGMVVVEEEIKL